MADDVNRPAFGAVPLRLPTGDAELRPLATLTSIGTAVDVALAELRLEAFLPADDAGADALTRLDETHRAGARPAPIAR